MCVELVASLAQTSESSGSGRTGAKSWGNHNRIAGVRCQPAKATTARFALLWPECHGSSLQLDRVRDLPMAAASSPFICTLLLMEGSFGRQAKLPSPVALTGVAMKLPKSLLEGHRRFLRDRHAPERGRYIQLAELGQSPTAMVIACCDARADVSDLRRRARPAVHPARNVANLVPPYEPEGKFHGTSAGH